jgi:uncharacterized phage protein (TIGR02220 family)
LEGAVSRVTVDFAALHDPRFIRLARELDLPGREYEARGRMLGVWALATERGESALKHIDVVLAFGPDLDRKEGEVVAALVASDLVERGELLRIRGFDGRCDWLTKKREAGAKGGKQSKKRRKAKPESASKQNGKSGEAKQQRGTPPPAPAPAPAPAQGDDPATRVIAELNRLTGASFKPTADSNRELILARLSEGYSEADLLAVVRDRVERWKGDEKMAEYLRPGTLFRKSKFADYVGQASTGDTAGQQSLADLMGPGFVDYDEVLP